MSPQPILWKRYLLEGMNEDKTQWDWTTLGISNTRSKKTGNVRAEVVAKSSGIWAAAGLAEAAEAVASEWGESLRVRSHISEGEAFKKNQKLSTWVGSPRAVFGLERAYLNLAAYVCGIATRTKKLARVLQKRKSPPRLAPTRKILPGYQDLAIHGVLVGGGHPHRVGLSGGVLIKENHIQAARGLRAAVEGVRRTAPHGLRIEAEIESVQQVEEALDVDLDGVLLDNFTPSQVKRALKQIQKRSPRTLVEVSGGVNEKNISSYAVPGVDVISVGRLTHSVESADFSLLVQK